MSSSSSGSESDGGVSMPELDLAESKSSSTLSGPRLGTWTVGSGSSPASEEAPGAPRKPSGDGSENKWVAKLRAWRGTIAGTDIRWTLSFRNSALERAFHEWVGNANAPALRFGVVGAIMFVGAVLLLVDLPSKDWRPNELLVGFRLSTMAFLALIMAISLRPQVFARYYDTLTAVLISVTLCSFLAGNVVKLNMDGVFMFCALSASMQWPFRSSLVRLGVVGFVTCCFFAVSVIVVGWRTALEFFIAPVVGSAGQWLLAMISIDRQVRRHFVLTYAHTNNKDVEAGVDSEPTSVRIDDHWDVGAVAKRALHFALFFKPSSEQSWWRREILYRHHVARKSRNFTRISLATFSATTLFMLAIELIVTQGQLDVLLVVIPRMVSVALPLVVAALMTKKNLDSVFGRRGGFDLLTVGSLLISALSLVWLEWLMYTKWRESSNGGEEGWQIEGSGIPPPHFVYTVLLSKQLFTMTASFKTPTVLDTIACVIVLGLRVTLVPTIDIISMLFLVAMCLYCAAVRERVDKVTFVVLDTADDVFRLRQEEDESKEAVDEVTETETEKLEKLAQEIASSSGLIGDRRSWLRKHRMVVVGSELVSWLVKTKNEFQDREDATRECKRLQRAGLLRHVSDEHTFEDGYLFYTLRTSTPKAKLFESDSAG
jgi:Domain found in Dishevelled, Egl-10, and Pleckstrin (DEP)